MMLASLALGYIRPPARAGSRAEWGWAHTVGSCARFGLNARARVLERGASARRFGESAPALAHSDSGKRPRSSRGRREVAYPRWR